MMSGRDEMLRARDPSPRLDDAVTVDVERPPVPVSPRERFLAGPDLRRFGRYIVLDVVGEGGMGVVLKGYDDELDRQVALKVLHANLSGGEGLRLKREAQALARLAHPNVVQVFEIGETEGQVFVAMELVKGQTLRQWQRAHDGPRPWAECVVAYLQAGRGLAAAHAKGLVHRDFKPGNAILDEEGRVRVLDFGLARQRGADGDELQIADGALDFDDPASLEHLEAIPLAVSLTETGVVLGTPAFMPPEQMMGQEVDARSDQFSFCVSLYEAVYGERPFEGDSLPALASAVTRGELRPAPEGSDVPASLRGLLLRGLATDPDKRWPSMDELLDRMERLLSDGDDEEISHLRRHIDPRVGGRQRVLGALPVGLAQIGTGVVAYVLEEAAGVTVGYPTLLTVCWISAVFIFGFVLDSLRRRVLGSRRRPMGMMNRMQMSLVVTSVLVVVGIATMGAVLGLPMAATMALVLLAFGLAIGTMVVFLPRMLVPASMCVTCSVLTAVHPGWRWLWWAASGGLGIVLMSWAWHGLRREDR